MKTAEELNTLKEQVNTLSAKLRELTDDELSEVTGGVAAVQDTSGQTVTVTQTSGQSSEGSDKTWVQMLRETTKIMMTNYGKD